MNLDSIGDVLKREYAIGGMKIPGYALGGGAVAVVAFAAVLTKQNGAAVSQMADTTQSGLTPPTPAPGTDTSALEKSIADTRTEFAGALESLTNEQQKQTASLSGQIAETMKAAQAANAGRDSLAAQMQSMIEAALGQQTRDFAGGAGASAPVIETTPMRAGAIVSNDYRAPTLTTQRKVTQNAAPISYGDHPTTAQEIAASRSKHALVGSGATYVEHSARFDTESIPAQVNPAGSPYSQTAYGRNFGAAAPSSYKVVSGDTLSAIAKRNNTTVTALAQKNNIANVNTIRAGQVLAL